MLAPLHSSQKERLAALRRYEILDTPQEEEFDEIVKLASDICGMPIAVISLVDEDRQWFKSEIGLGIRETPIENSICSHVILGDDVLEIEDTQADVRTADNSLCIPEDGLRFYAGTPLTDPAGLPIGTLCVMDHKPNALNEMQKKALQVLSKQIMRELDLRRALQAQRVLRDEMDHRVKNSLQSVSSMLRMYERMIAQGTDPSEVFSGLKRQIDSIISVHAELHRSDEIEALDARSYIETLLSHLQHSIPTGIRIEPNLVALQIGPHIATTLGVVINEFVANSIKHAFGDQCDNEEGCRVPCLIRVTLSKTPTGLHLHCSDNGAAACPAQKAPLEESPVEGLGKRLVTAGIARLGGTLNQGPTEDGYALKADIPVD